MKIEALINDLDTLLKTLIEKEKTFDNITKNVHADYKLSAKNLLRYLVLRSTDLRSYHGTLSDLGVSSLRSAEGYVFANLFNVVKHLYLLQGKVFDLNPNVELVGFTGSQQLIRTHARTLFSKLENDNSTEIMVTLPNEAASDINLIKSMIESGMDIARINLSHGDYKMWQSMVNSIKELEQEIGKKIKIYMDLSGPKLRTSEINLIGRRGKVKNSIRVKVGEHIILAKDLNGYSDTASQNKKKHKKKVVEVMLHEVIEDAQIGEKVLFDDGMIRSTIVDKNKDYLELEITACYKEKIGSHKGINLPNTQLNLPALTEKDIEDLPFACKYADLIGYSFVRTPEDVNTLYRQLDKNKARDLGIVFKIENEQAFKNLPGILIKGMERNNIGVMIARGDLAVEIGFERISEVQNQILLICEAAHIPAIWATQVLENLAKTGIPTRAEISDVVLSAQAECVMLNKGDYILNAIQVLKNILHRVEGQSFKNKNELRALNVAQEFTKKL